MAVFAPRWTLQTNQERNALRDQQGAGSRRGSTRNRMFSKSIWLRANRCIIFLSYTQLYLIDRQLSRGPDLVEVLWSRPGWGPDLVEALWCRPGGRWGGLLHPSGGSLEVDGFVVFRSASALTCPPLFRTNKRCVFPSPDLSPEEKKGPRLHSGCKAWRPSLFGVSD